MSISYVLPPKEIREIIDDCIYLSYNTYVDELDCSKSFTRQPTMDKSLEEVLKIAFAEPKTRWSFIFRKGWGAERDYWEVGSRTAFGEVDYFLWINLDVTAGKEIIRKYGLRET